MKYELTGITRMKRQALKQMDQYVKLQPKVYSITCKKYKSSIYYQLLKHGFICAEVCVELKPNNFDWKWLK